MRRGVGERGPVAGSSGPSRSIQAKPRSEPENRDRLDVPASRGVSPIGAMAVAWYNHCKVCRHTSGTLHCSPRTMWRSTQQAVWGHARLHGSQPWFSMGWILCLVLCKWRSPIGRDRTWSATLSLRTAMQTCSCGSDRSGLCPNARGAHALAASARRGTQQALTRRQEALALGEDRGLR